MKESTEDKSRSKDLTQVRPIKVPSTVPPNRSKIIVQSALWSAIVALLTLIGSPFPPPLSTINLAPIAIFVVGVYFGPRIGLITATLGSAVGFVLGVNLGTVSAGGSFFPAFWLGIVLARGPEGFLIGWLRRFDESLAMIVGTVYETLVFFGIDYFYTYPILLGTTGVAAFVAASPDFLTLVDLVFVGPAILVLRAIRRSQGRNYYGPAP